MQLIHKLMLQCQILSEYYVSMFSSTRFFKVIHLTICFHEHKVQNHHRIPTNSIQEMSFHIPKQIEINESTHTHTHTHIYISLIA